MTQSRILDFGAPRRSSLLNTHYKGILPAGVYKGFFVQQTFVPSMSLNIELNGATESVLLTNENVRIAESLTLSSAVTLAAAHATLPRKDIIVAQHTFSNLNNPAVYIAVAGTPAASPIAPTPAANQILLATVFVGAAVTFIVNANITNVSAISLGNPFGSFITQAGLDMLRPHEETVIANTVFVETGRFVKSDGTGSVLFAGGSSPAFAPVTIVGESRIDLLTIDDLAVLGVQVGVQALVPTVPTYPSDKQVIAEVLIDETGAVLIADSDITDVRFFLNLGGGSGSTTQPQLSVQTASGGQTVFTTPFSYDIGENELLVFASGVFMTLGSDYTETTTTSITFLSGRVVGESVTIWKVGPTVTPIIGGIQPLRTTITSTSGQTVYPTTFSYTTGQDEILVFSGGVYMTSGDDYTETSSTSITFGVGRPLGEKVTIWKVGDSTGAMNAANEQIFSATAGQLLFTLTLFTYTTGAKQIMVFQNGLLQDITVDYTETSTSSITLTVGAALGDSIKVVKHPTD